MKKLLVGLAALALTSSVYAGANTNTGCGLGSVLIKDQNTVLTQILAATTNGTSGNQTFGITSGTLNCDKPSIIASNDKLNRFVGENMDELALDISAGQGETLSTVAKLMNVKDTASFSAKLQKNFNNIYASKNVNSANVIDSIAKFI
jgi:hypothetical protein